MKILMVSDFYPPIIGGMEREVQSLSEGLYKKGHDVIVCTVKQGFFPLLSVENGVRVYRLSGLFQKLPFLFRTAEMQHHPPVMDLLITKKLEDIIRKERPDIVHAHGWILYSVAPLEKKFGIPLCVSFHDFGFICPRRVLPLHKRNICRNPLSKDCLVCGKETYGLLKSFLVYSALKLNKAFRCDIVIYTNPHLGERLSSIKGTKVYLPHPIDTDEFRPLEVKEYNDRILCWTKLDRSKGIEIIFEAAKHLTDYQFDIPFVGLGKEHYKLIKPKNVYLIPAQDKKEVPGLIAKYPLILGQFMMGVFGLSELEAMSCGKPLIASWDEKYDSLYEDPCPILNAANAKDLVGLIKSNIGNANAGRLNREWILKNHSISKVIARLTSIYEQVLR